MKRKRKRNPVSASRVRKTRSRRADMAGKLAKAGKLYSDFHGMDPKQIKRYPHPKIDVGMRVGRVIAIAYEADHGERYVHKFTGASRPWLISSHNGKTLALVGGRFKMTERGIEDR